MLPFELSWGLASYTGYSGAPGSRGTCASSCHGSGAGTIVVTGFPTVYDPGSAYTIVVTHQGGSPISNFNSSVRVGAGPHTAGTIAAGFGTSTYAVNPEEPSGVHFTDANQDSGTFNWTAPDSGVGDVKLYLAGLQGDMGGPNTAVALTATQNPSSVREEPDVRSLRPSLVLANRVVTDYLLLQVSIPGTNRAQLRIHNQWGGRVASIDLASAEGVQAILWEPNDSHGRRLAPGSHFVSLFANGRRLTRKFAFMQ
jgi:hypothetical protein